MFQIHRVVDRSVPIASPTATCFPAAEPSRSGSIPQPSGRRLSTPSATRATGILVGPGYFNVNLTLERNLLVHERYNIDLRGEAFNAFNHPNFDNPAAVVGNATAGIIGSMKGDPRILQVS